MSDLLSRCTAFLLAQQCDVYLVGGTVRDQELGRESHDIDLAAPSAALHIARQLADHLGGAYYPLDTERETGRVVLPDHSVIDVARLRGSDIAADLAARDFTVNAMARRLSEPNSLIDPHAGLLDLREKRLRAVSDQVFADDPARLLRAVRLSFELVFRIEPETYKLIERNAGLAESIAGERVRDELLRMLQWPTAAAYMLMLRWLGLVSHILAHSSPDDAHLSVLEPLAWIAAGTFPVSDIARLSYEFGPLLEMDLRTNLDTGQTNAVIVKLAALYDRPEDITIDLGRLRFRRDEIYYARMLVAGRERVRALSLPVAPLDAHRFFRDTGSGAGRMGLLLLALAESPSGASAAQVAVVRQLLRYYRDMHDQVIAPAPLINGAELAARFGLRGRQIGDALTLLLEAQVQGEVHTVADAERFLQGYG